MAAGISTLIDSGIEDIRTGKINEIDIEKGFEDAMLNFAGNIVGAVAAGLVPDVYVPASRQKARYILRKANQAYNGPAARTFIKKMQFRKQILTYWEILLMSW